MAAEPGSKQAYLQDSPESPGGFGGTLHIFIGTPGPQGPGLLSQVANYLIGGECLIDSDKINYMN